MWRERLVTKMYAAPFSKIIGLGCNCATAAAIRSHVGVDQAYPLDWWVTEHKALCNLLDGGFADLFVEDDLFVAHVGAVQSKKYGVRYHHAFPFQDDVVTEGIASHIPALTGKFGFLVERLDGDVMDNKVLFIRVDETVNPHPAAFFAQRAAEILQRLDARWPTAENHLLYVTQTNQGLPVTSSDGRVVYRYFADEPGEDMWRGGQWRKLLTSLDVRISAS